MAWNTEVAAVSTDEFADVVPDVFVPTDTSTMGFEDATSGSRYGDLWGAKFTLFVLD